MVGEWVRPGNIILRQKGTKWHPGENVPPTNPNFRFTSLCLGMAIDGVLGSYGAGLYGCCIGAGMGSIL